MNAKEFSSHYQSYRRFAIDTPISLSLLSRLVSWRDHQVAKWPSDVSALKETSIKSIAILGTALTLAASIAEYFLRDLLFLFSLPLQTFHCTRIFSVRIYESSITNLCVILFGFETLGHHLHEKCVGKKMIHPRLAHYYLDFLL